MQGTILPESVGVIATVPMRDSIHLIARGLVTNQVHQPFLDTAQLAQLKIAPKDPPFDGDAARFRLGILALWLEPTREYAPLSIERIRVPRLLMPYTGAGA